MGALGVGDPVPTPASALTLSPSTHGSNRGVLIAMATVQIAAVKMALCLGTLPRRASSEEYLGGGGTLTSGKTCSDDNRFMQFIAIRMLTLRGLYRLPPCIPACSSLSSYNLIPLTSQRYSTNNLFLRPYLN